MVFASEFEDCVVDLLDPDKIPQIKAIADTMFASNCDWEFCEVSVRFGKAAFDVYLDVDELSSEDAVLMEWNLLHSSSKKWRCAIKKFIVVYLYKAKLIFDQVLGEYGDSQFKLPLIEASKPFLVRFLNVGESLAVGLNTPEGLFTMLDMHHDLAELIPSLETSFPDEMASYILAELHNLLARLGSRVKAILMEFRDLIRTAQLSSIRGGRIHPILKYVVNYIVLLKEYDPTLTSIIEDRNQEDSDAEQSTLAAHLLSITSALEAKITDVSNLCNDTSLEHIFVMNNIHYMVAKINNSKIKDYFGDEWVRRRTVTFRLHALSYLRSTWSSILHLLRYEEKVDRATMKARYKDFTTAFEHVYENQTRWVVPNLELRQEVKISASTALVSAYRTFVGLMGHRLLELAEESRREEEVDFISQT